MKKYTLANIMTAMGIFGGIMSNPRVMVEFLRTERNEFQEDMAAYSFYNKHMRLPETEAELEEGFKTVKQMQANLRGMLANAFQRDLDRKFDSGYSPETAKAIERNKLDELAVQHRQAKKPGEHGTVAEIASTYRISKSEVRRLKAAGELDAFIAHQKETGGMGKPFKSPGQ